MTIWKVIANNEYRSAILIDDTGTQITDNCCYFEQLQEQIPERKLIFLDEDKQFPDIANYIAMPGSFLVNEKAKQVLETNFKKIQFFPTTCKQYPDKPYWVVSVLNYQEVLHIPKCKYTTMKNYYGKIMITNIKKYAFTEEAKPLDIFKLTISGDKRPYQLYVSDRFQQIIEEHHFTGLNLEKVYEFQ